MWLAVDESGREYIYESEPKRSKYTFSSDHEYVEVPKGTIQRLLNYPLTWDDDCQEIVEYKDSNILKEDKVIKRNIKMRVTPEQSKKVQEICFANGVCWVAGKNIIQFEDQKYLYINDKYITFGATYKYFEKQDEQEVDADLFIRTNGTCEESRVLNDDTQRNIVFAPNADEHLRQKIVNLHDQLNKNRKTVQNQKEELTKLLSQKKQLNNRLDIYALCNDNQKIKITNLLAQKEELQSQLNMANKTVGMSIDTDIKLIRLLEEKDEIIKYLENKLKI